MSTFNDIHCKGHLTILDPESQNPIDVYKSALLFRQISTQAVDNTVYTESMVYQLGRIIFGYVIYKSDTPAWHSLFNIPYSNIEGDYTNSIKMHHNGLWIHPEVGYIAVGTNQDHDTTSTTSIVASFYTIVF